VNEIIVHAPENNNLIENQAAGGQCLLLKMGNLLRPFAARCLILEVLPS
jgi:hypothetical protein